MDRAAIYGNWRAQVVDNKDTKKFGRVLVWVPDLMPEVNKKEGIWARPANNPLGGRNMEADSDHHYMGTSYIPKKGSWVFVFFEGGNINLPYYFGALELENTTVLPENQVGSNYENKWVLLKTHEGRTIVMSDDPDDARTEITGKKRQLSSPPTGDTGSVYTIDENQTTILFDEREGKEKVLIRTHKGDFFHIDIDEQKLQAEFEGDIIIKTNGKFQVTAEDDIDILSNTGNVAIEAGSGDLNIKADSKVNQESGSDFNIRSGGDLNLEATKSMNELAGGVVSIDGTSLSEQSGTATPANLASGATEAEPEGGRDT
jgi:hypothetical protein